MPGPMPRGPVNRFFDHLAIGNGDQCWQWKASTAGNGYGSFWESAAAGNVLAHRFMWELVCGAIPDGLEVLHKCDNPACCNPDHLFLGTQSDNIKDMYAKGRGVNNDGENHPRHKLTDDLVLEIRRLWKTGRYKQKELAEKFNVHQCAISRIVNNRRWGHLAETD